MPLNALQDFPIEAVGYFKDLGGEGSDIYNQRIFLDTTGGAIPGFPGFDDFDPDCGTRWEHPEQSVANHTTLRIIEY